MFLGCIFMCFLEIELFKKFLGNFIEKFFL